MSKRRKKQTVTFSHLNSTKCDVFSRIFLIFIFLSFFHCALRPFASKLFTYYKKCVDTKLQEKIIFNWPSANNRQVFSERVHASKLVSTPMQFTYVKRTVRGQNVPILYRAKRVLGAGGEMCEYYITSIANFPRAAIR